MITTIRQYIYLLFFSFVFISCHQKHDEFKQFRLLNGEEANLHFINSIKESDTLNPINYAYIYNGAGVGIADINNDGLQDIYFAGNQVSGRLYLNKGNLKFEDITEKAGILTNRWCTGVSMVDINTDGYIDIYVCAADKNYTEKGRNLLFINNGDNTFTEQAKDYGLDDKNYSTQAAFFDYDLDGDLDLYLLTNGIEDFPPNNARPIKKHGKGISTDRLYRNNAVECKENSASVENNSFCKVPFIEVSKEAGILIEGYGLGVAISDINQDGFPDVYCSNDFISNDLLWINNGDGTFTDQLKEYTRQTTYNGMGVDIADFNNDQLPDIVEMDMLPEDNQHTKTMLMPMNYDKFQMKTQMGYQNQFYRNTLQMNNGNGSFSEVGRLAGISRTDWSWAPLLVDMDNDGLRDLFVSNGYGRDVTDLDFVVYGMQENYSFGGKINNASSHFEEVQKLPGIYLSNYFYKNKGDLTFEDKTQNWGVKKPSYSNGAAFADLDNDGDIDFVVSNINDTPFIYENLESQNPNKKNFLRVKLKGPKLNPNGIGTKIWLYNDSLNIFHEQYLVRGYKSTIEENIHFGVGYSEFISKIKILWPDGKVQILSDLGVNQVIEVDYNEAVLEENIEQPKKNFFSNYTHPNLPQFTHIENTLIDFKTQPLLHKMNSRSGPGIAVADINNDSLQDFFVGGASGQSGVLFIQNTDFSFEKVLLDETNLKNEDTGCLFFDADNDGDTDLYVASGGALFFANGEFSSLYQDRLYLNDGEGNFEISESSLPKMQGSASSVVASDYDKDGDLDLFIGGKLDPKKYPYPGESYLLQNDNGVFKDITSSVESLQHVGMVSSAIWTDFNNDNWIDLIVVGEWMPVTFFENKNGKLINITNKSGLENYTGWWNSINAGDFDADGDIDYIVGNLGYNSVLKASVNEPVEIYAKDFDNSGNIDPVLFHYTKGKSHPFAMRDALIDQINGMKGRFKDYKSYSNATLEDVFTEKELEGALHLNTKTFATSFIENLGSNNFKIKALPIETQISPVFGTHIKDFDADGNLDVLLVGNNTNVESLFGFFDASYGLLLKGDGKSNFSPTNPIEVGLKTIGNARGLTLINNAKGNSILICTKNNDELQFFNTTLKHNELINLQEDDVYGEVYFKNSNRKQKIEFYYGEGYFSQNGRKYLLNENVKKIIIYNSEGKQREIFRNPI